ncbi:hypothetical protein J3D55_002065 [Chryseobacterium ginsenosidimutans]|uniref:hypothetical protein n=1 Tax=Chryseobacterium ginsenosidimutans TaxID=687846 RepID=UPI002169AE93|nr:hypothetical protein [Chryseobacterium ginsenosidimutans]MCS3869149.1 hypothetical protein [Chryseobacterium ginsenosidimutans]
MKKRIFEYKAVYYLALIASFLLLFFSFKAVMSLFNDYNILKLLFVPSALILNLFTFINLIGKYKRAILFLNITLCLFIFLTGRATITDILTQGLSLEYDSYKYLLSFLVVLIITNKYKVRRVEPDNEIDDIGKHND